MFERDVIGRYERVTFLMTDCNLMYQSGSTGPIRKSRGARGRTRSLKWRYDHDRS